MQARCTPALRPALVSVHDSISIPSITPRYISVRHNHQSHKSASEKLFADAAREEENVKQPSRKSTSHILEQEHENWTGEERIQDTVLRMLVDKYKPLRGPAVVSADQKLKQSPPHVWSSSATTVTYVQPRSGSWADEPLLPSNESHKPWETTFKAPSLDTSSIKSGRLPPLVSGQASALSGAASTDERLMRKEKEVVKKTRHMQRLSRALDSTLDYKLGLHGQAPVSRRNPVSLKGWNGMIEEKIEKARSLGLFNNVKGRGQPLTRTSEEANPFIAREEFLMNRIVQRNGAAPPWVEIQGELDSAVKTFREVLRQSWIRRAVRILTTHNPVELLNKITLREIKELRDPEWIKKERSYHETALAELNSLVRKYNGLAPYAVRRPYYSHEAEIQRMYETCVNEIMRELSERSSDPGFIGNAVSTGGGGRVGPVPTDHYGSHAGEWQESTVNQQQGAPSWGLRDLFREWIDKVTSRWKW